MGILESTQISKDGVLPQFRRLHQPSQSIQTLVNSPADTIKLVYSEKRAPFIAPVYHGYCCNISTTQYRREGILFAHLPHFRLHWHHLQLTSVPICCKKVPHQRGDVSTLLPYHSQVNLHVTRHAEREWFQQLHMLLKGFPVKGRHGISVARHSQCANQMFKFDLDSRTQTRTQLEGLL